MLVSGEVRLSDLTTMFYFLSTKEVFLYRTKKISNMINHTQWGVCGRAGVPIQVFVPLLLSYGLRNLVPQRGLQAPNPAPQCTQLCHTCVALVVPFAWDSFP